MVNIEFISTAACPVCGCKTVVSESVETSFGTVRRHTNGTKWEHRRFACGYYVHYVPNYGREEVLRACSLDPEEKKKKERQAQLKEAVIQKIDDGDCPDEYKERLKRAIEYL